MRALLFPLTALLAGCATPEVTAPSLAPRAAESIDPRVPVPEPVLPAAADAQLVARLEALVAQARAGDALFQAAADDARRLASAAGPPESESWVVAQQALSVAVAARAPVARAIAEIDSLGAERIQAQQGIAAANLRAILAAAAEVSAIDRRQSATVTGLQAELRG